MRASRLAAPFAVAGVLIAAAPARAGLVNTYGPSDDTWGEPVATGHYLLDARFGYTFQAPAPAALPSLSLVWGLPGSAEVGVYSSYSLGGANAGPTALGPYVKWRVPGSLCGVSLGLVAGAQVPLQSGTDRTVALEGIAIVPMPAGTSLDVDLGVGRDLSLPDTLGHACLAFYAPLPGGMSGTAEAYTLVSGSVAPSYGQNFGVSLPLGSQTTVDAGVALSEAAIGFSGVTPHVGWTRTW